MELGVLIINTGPHCAARHQPQMAQCLEDRTSQIRGGDFTGSTIPDPRDEPDVGRDTRAELEYPT